MVESAVIGPSPAESTETPTNFKDLLPCTITVFFCVDPTAQDCTCYAESAVLTHEAEVTIQNFLWRTHNARTADHGLKNSEARGQYYTDALAQSSSGLIPSGSTVRVFMNRDSGQHKKDFEVWESLQGEIVEVPKADDVNPPNRADSMDPA